MKPLPLALGAATLAAFAAIIGFAAYSEVVQHLPSLFLESEFISLVVLILLLAALGWAALVRNRSGEASRRLNVVAMLAVGLGLLVTLLLFNNPGLVCVDETKADMLKVMGPHHAQTLMPLAFGLLAATVATARAGSHRARASRSSPIRSA